MRCCFTEPLYVYLPPMVAISFTVANPSIARICGIYSKEQDQFRTLGCYGVHAALATFGVYALIIVGLAIQNCMKNRQTAKQAGSFSAD
jgi:hypothetical protein